MSPKPQGERISQEKYQCEIRWRAIARILVPEDGGEMILQNLVDFKPTTRPYISENRDLEGSNCMASKDTSWTRGDRDPVIWQIQEPLARWVAPGKGPFPGLRDGRQDSLEMAGNLSNVRKSRINTQVPQDKKFCSRSVTFRGELMLHKDWDSGLMDDSMSDDRHHQHHYHTQDKCTSAACGFQSVFPFRKVLNSSSDLF